MADNGIDQYKVSISQKELDKLQRWGEWANKAGVLDEESPVVVLRVRDRSGGVEL